MLSRTPDVEMFLSAASCVTVGTLCRLTSTCIHSEWAEQMSAMASRGSTAPYTVVPAVAFT